MEWQKETLKPLNIAKGPHISFISRQSKHQHSSSGCKREPGPRKWWWTKAPSSLENLCGVLFCAIFNIKEVPWSLVETPNCYTNFCIQYCGWYSVETDVDMVCFYKNNNRVRILHFSTNFSHRKLFGDSHEILFYFFFVLLPHICQQLARLFMKLSHQFFTKIAKFWSLI